MLWCQSDRTIELSLFEIFFLLRLSAIEGGEHPVRAIRKYRGLTQSAVAGRAGLRQGYIADIEGRRKIGSAVSLKRIAEALGVPLGVLVV